MKMRLLIETAEKFTGPVGERLELWHIVGVTDSTSGPTERTVARLDARPDIEVILLGVQAAQLLPDGRYRVGYHIEKPTVPPEQLVGQVLVAERKGAPKAPPSPRRRGPPMMVAQQTTKDGIDRLRLTREGAELLLSAPRSADVLSGIELFAIALSVSNASRLTVSAALAILHEHGLPTAPLPTDLLQRIARGAQADPSLSLDPDGETFRLDPATDIERWLCAMNLQTRIDALLYGTERAHPPQR